jgi:hypothetical protein
MLEEQKRLERQSVVLTSPVEVDAFGKGGRPLVVAALPAFLQLMA